MKTYEYIYQYSDINFSFICDNPEKLLYFDIETTGLSAKRSDLYMIGYGYMQDKQFKLVLLFNDDGCSEPDMLARFNQIMADYQYLVSYNGDTFDIPYMLEKYDQFEQKTCMKSLTSFDIYRIMRRYKKLLHMKSMKQHDLEELLQYRRQEFISGGDLIQEYKNYLLSGSEILLSHLLHHNLEDIDGLIHITNILSVHQFFSGNFSIRDLKLQDEYAKFYLNVPELPIRLNYGYREAYINGIGTELIIRLPINNTIMKYYFSDYRNYYYLPVEDTAIHKSMAEYVDKDYKEKATKATAYCKQEGQFLIQCKPPLGNCYKNDITEKDSYLLIDQNFCEDSVLQKTYLKYLLQSII